MFNGEIVEKNPFKRKFGLRKFLVLDRVQDRVQGRVLDRVQTKVGLRKFSPKIFFFAKSLKM